MCAFSSRQYFAYEAIFVNFFGHYREGLQSHFLGFYVARGAQVPQFGELNPPSYEPDTYSPRFSPLQHFGTGPSAI